MKNKIALIGALFSICVLVLLAGCREKERVYHWAVIQAEDFHIEEASIQKINERLEQMGVQGKIEFHYVTVKGLITPETIEKAYEELDEKMDFVSIPPALAAFSKEEWQNTFIELGEELQAGGLNEFYKALPPAVWTANEMAGGIYSFSNRKQIRPHGFIFYQPLVERIGKETLLKITEANGVADEAIWKELYEANGERPICAWAGLDFGTSIVTPNVPYEHSVLERIANAWHEHDYAMLNDDIGYRYETDEFEWLGESDVYEQIRSQVIDFYKKGYLRRVDFDAIRERDEDTEAGQLRKGYDNQIWEIQADGKVVLTPYIWVPSWPDLRITTKSDRGFMYSFVYQKAQKGWQEILNAMGTDETIINYLHGDVSKPSLLITSILYEELAIPLEVGDRYTFLEDVYEKAEEDPSSDFIFNPLPVQEMWEEYNQKAIILASANFIKDVVYTLEDGTQRSKREINLEYVEDFWGQYKSAMKETPIKELVEEINRQYREWKAAS